MVHLALLQLTSLATLWCLAAIAPSVNAHSFLVKPVARDTGVHPDMTNTMACPTTRIGTVTSFRSGEKIDVRYWRNNHIGGFIRWSLVPRGQETKANLDNSAFYYTCRESGPECVPKRNADKPIAGDGSGDYTISCGDTITLPDWLPAGDYVLQWTWFGVGHSSNNLGWAEPQFRSCADIKLTTSGSLPTSKKPACPTFVGGDRVTKAQKKTSDQCFYFYTTDIVGERYKGSNDESVAMPLYKFGIPKPVERCQGANKNDTNSDSESDKETDTSTTKPTPVPSTTTTTPSPSTTTQKPATNKPVPSCRRKNHTK